MQPIHLAFLWHQHQPFYKDVLRRQYVLPWVRLHAIKDYIGLLLVFKEFPEIRCNVNLVPSLLLQIQEYADGRAVDHALAVTRQPAANLHEASCLHMLDHFFVGNAARIIDIFPRYRELKERRGAPSRPAKEALHDFRNQDLLDLQVWATLAWFHPLVVESDPALKELRRKGREFTEQDKAVMLERQDAVIGRVLPLHRELAEAGQIELSTTPFYHPILPLLCNMECAREALPGLPMPDTRSDFRGDADVHVQRALEFHTEVFGRRPTGIWPAEGSVSMDILPLLRGKGLRWIATDEQILQRSAGADLSRDGSACLLNPDDLYQPYRLPGDGDLPAIVFRDRGLADAIGFEYHHGPSQPGGENFVWRIEEGARRCKGAPRLISVILDGENPWDYYEDSGVPFLRETFGRIARSQAVKSTRLCDYLAEHPPERKLERLAAGSWINANFAIWIGAVEDRAAWSLVAETREALLRRAERAPRPSVEALAAAWEELYVAEGSDWCWWLGGDHTSEQDYMFDELFRDHLSSVYKLVGEEPPASLSKPIGKPPRPVMDETPEPEMASRQGIDEGWKPAGIHRFGEQTAMGRSGAIEGGLMYWFHGRQLFLDIQANDSAIGVGAQPIHFVVHFICGAREQVSDHVPVVKGEVYGRYRCTRSYALCDLAPRPADQIEFFVEICRAEDVIQRIPGERGVRVSIPAQ